MFEVKDLVVNYDEAVALKGVSLNVEPGELVCLLGPNGAGKTTLLNAICGVVKASSGTIRYLGESITNLEPCQIHRKGISQVPEGRRIFGSLSVADNLKAGAYSRSEPTVHSDLETYYERFPILKERSRQRGDSLSGGQQQIVAIVRALMSRPKFLLLDEPSLGLAPIIILEVFEMIKEIHRQGTAVLLVEQNAKLALEVSSRAYIIDNGTIVLNGTSQSVATSDVIQRVYLGK